MKRRKMHKGKVFVGLSGGVDSSVSAALLLKKGYEVSGVFIKVWQPDFLPCTWRDERRDAMRVAAHLNIPFYTYDFEDVYKKGVIDYMLAEYERGRTPNPDVMCNAHVKFGAFKEKAFSMGADFIATGHYARIEAKGEKAALLAGADKEKDQSYFLWQLEQKDLLRIFFPVGEFKKAEVRKLAHSFGLPTAEKKDSQGLCFVGKLDMRDFLKQFFPEKKGDVLSSTGEKIGTHEGARFYTIGQRHGFAVTEHSENDRPRYVVSKDLKRNTIVVSERPLEEGGQREIVLERAHWIGKKPVSGKKYAARVRYRQPLRPCALENDGRTWKLHFEEDQSGIAPGQSAVIYDGERCVGGGIIA